MDSRLKMSGMTEGKLDSCFRRNDGGGERYSTETVEYDQIE